MLVVPMATGKGEKLTELRSMKGMSSQALWRLCRQDTDLSEADWSVQTAHCHSKERRDQLLSAKPVSKQPHLVRKVVIVSDAKWPKLRGMQKVGERGSRKEQTLRCHQPTAKSAPRTPMEKLQ